MLVTSLRITVLKICISPIDRETYYLAEDVICTEDDVAQLHDAAARQSFFTALYDLQTSRQAALCKLRSASGDRPVCNLTFIHLFGLSLCPNEA
jgi:hypothetical protein